MRPHSTLTRRVRLMVRMVPADNALPNSRGQAWNHYVSFSSCWSVWNWGDPCRCVLSGTRSSELSLWWLSDPVVPFCLMLMFCSVCLTCSRDLSLHVMFYGADPGSFGGTLALRPQEVFRACGVLDTVRMRLLGRFCLSAVLSRVPSGVLRSLVVLAIGNMAVLLGFPWESDVQGRRQGWFACLQIQRNTFIGALYGSRQSLEPVNLCKRAGVKLDRYSHAS